MWLCFVGGKCYNDWASFHACFGGKLMSFGLLLTFIGVPRKCGPSCKVLSLLRFYVSLFTTLPPTLIGPYT